MSSERKKVYLGYWDGEPIWRYQTAEEMLRENGIKPEVANLYIALNEKNANNKE